MPSKLATIPSEAVASRAAATAAVLSALTCIENRDISVALLNKADTYPTEDKYKAEAYRRAAVLVAQTEFSFMTQKVIDEWNGLNGLNEFKPMYGFPSRWSSSTANFIYQYIKTTLLKKDIAKNMYACFPPEWRSGMLEDDVRIPLAIEAIQYCSDYYFVPQGGYKHFPNSILYSSHKLPPTAQQAYNFYNRWNTEQRTILLDAIYSIIGFDA